MLYAFLFSVYLFVNLPVCLRVVMSVTVYFIAIVLSNKVPCLVKHVKPGCEIVHDLPEY